MDEERRRDQSRMEKTREDDRSLVLSHNSRMVYSRLLDEGILFLEFFRML